MITICATCSLALVANPCLEQDEQIARNLQQKEEQEAKVIRLQREDEREKLQHASPMEQVTFFVDEIESNIHTSNGFRRLPSDNFQFQATSFILSTLSMGAGTKVSIAYIFTDSDDVTFDYIARHGFLQDDMIGFGLRMALSDSCSDAWENFIGNPPHRNFQSLFPIAASHDDMGTLTARGWLVAVSEFDRNDMSKMRWVPSHNIFPLVSFDPQIRSENQVSSLKISLEAICIDFFEATLFHLDPLDPDVVAEHHAIAQEM